MKRFVSLILIGTIICACLGAIPASAAEEAIINAGFEDGSSIFSVRGECTETITSDEAHSGQNSLLLSGRGDQGWHGVSTSIVNDVKLDETYNMSMYVKAATPGESFTVKIGLELNDDTQTDYPQVASAAVNSESWTLIEGSYTVDYTGNLNTLNFNIETESDGNGKSFYVDDIYVAHEGVEKPVVETVQTSYSYSGIEIPVDVEGTSIQNKVILFESLGIVSGYEDGTFRPDNQVTRAEYVTLLMRLQGLDGLGTANTGFEDVSAEHYASGAIASAVASGIVSGYDSTHFGPDDNVTYIQAVKMLVGILGYSVMAENSGGYPSGYASMAANLGLTASVVSNDEPMTREQVIELLYSALDVPLAKWENISIKIDNDSNLLSHYFDCYSDKGIVMATNKTSLIGYRASAANVIISGYEVGIGTTRAEELLGYNVEYYYIEQDGDYEIIYIEPTDTKNRSFTIEADDIVEYNANAYTYLTEDGTEKTVRLESGFNLVYNGRVVEDDYDSSYMVPQTGSVILFAGDGGSYDTVFVTAYETLVVASATRSTYTVYDKFNGSIEIDPDDFDEYSMQDSSGNDIAFSELKEYDVLQILRPYDNDNEYITIVVIRDNASGTVERVSDDSIRIDGEVYDLADYYLNNSTTTISVNSEITAYLDISGQVVYIEEGINASLRAGYLMNAWYDSNSDENGIKLLTDNGEIVTYEASDSIQIDGKKYKDTQTAFNIIRGDVEKTEKKLVLYSLNSSGKINEIDLFGSESSSAVLSIVADGKFTYKSSVRVFFDDGNNGTEKYPMFPLDDNVVVFSVPKEGSTGENDMEEYTVKSVSSIYNDTEYELIAAKADDDTIYAQYLVLYEDSSDTSSFSSKDMYIIRSISDTLNKSGELVKGFTVYINGEEQEYVLKNSTVWDNMLKANFGVEPQENDVVRFDIDANGEISKMALLSDEGEYDDWFYADTGYLLKKEKNMAYISLSRPTQNGSVDSNTVLVPLNQFKITILDMDTNEVYEGSVGDLVSYEEDPQYYSKVLFTMSYENPMQLICINGEE